MRWVWKVLVGKGCVAAAMVLAALQASAQSAVKDSLEKFLEEGRERAAYSERDRERFNRQSSEFMRSLDEAETRRELRALRRSIDDLNSTIELDRRRSE